MSLHTLLSPGANFPIDGMIFSMESSDHVYVGIIHLKLNSNSVLWFLTTKIWRSWAPIGMFPKFILSMDNVAICLGMESFCTTGIVSSKSFGDRISWGFD